MAKMKYFNGSSWVVLDANNAQTLQAHPSSDFILNSGGAPSIKEGTDASKGAAGNTGSLYIATDTKFIYRDNGRSWDKIGSLDSIAWGSVTGKPTTVAASGLTDAETTSGSQAKANAAQTAAKSYTDSSAAHYKSGTGTFSAGNNTQIFTDSFCTASTFVTVCITGTPLGIWTTNGSAGSFTITSDTTETADVTFNYYMIK